MIDIKGMRPEEIKDAMAHIASLPVHEQEELLAMLETLDEMNQMQGRKDHFLEFIKHVYPGYKVGEHHKKLAQIFEDIANGKKKRVIVNIAPRHGKSELISYLAPAWFLGKYPHKKVIMASHTADLAVNFGRRVRNLVGSTAYKEVFTDVQLQADSKSASRWGTNHQGEYFAIGVGGALAGRGADLFIIDDPHSEQDAKLGRSDVFKPAWEWFQSGPIQRLMPGGAIIVVMCMTGDTPVLMANGTEKRLDSLNIGDSVATYEDGKLALSSVLNHRSNGVDTVYTVKTQSGIMVRANERHPLLVDVDGEHKWIRLKNLKVGMSLVVAKDVVDQRGHKINQTCAEPANQKEATTKNTPTPHITHKGIMESGKTKLALTPNVSSQPILKDCARTTITKIGGRLGTEQHPMMLRQGGQSDLKVDMALTKKAIIKYFKHKTGYALYVVNRLLNKTLAATGVTNYVLTTTTIQEKLEPFYAMTVTSPSDMQKNPLQQKPLQNTSDFITDKIESITYDGKEEVFDVQIDRTENFIANGIVSHNTRWSKLDLTGEIVNQMLKNDEVDEWEVVEFPAIIDDKDGVEKSLWPEFWPLEELHAKRAALDVRYWNAQYLQNPTSEEGALIKREWWSRWTRDNPPSCEFIIMSLDAAQEKNTRADYNALTTWGVFFNEETDNYNIILLNAIKERLEFPELKDMCLREYKDWEPDAFIIEKKSNGAALYQEFRRMGIPLGEFTPGKGQDKIARVNSVSDLFRSGIVWAPEKRWAEEVIEECNDFPSGSNDDLVDSTTMALMRFRQGGFIRLPSDEDEEVKGFRSSKGKALYAI